MPCGSSYNPGHYPLSYMSTSLPGITGLVVDNGVVSNGSRYHNVLAFTILSSLLPSFIYVDLSTFQAVILSRRNMEHSFYCGGGGLGACPQASYRVYCIVLYRTTR